MDDSYALTEIEISISGVVLAIVRMQEEGHLTKFQWYPPFFQTMMAVVSLGFFLREGKFPR
jgi:hypothetical protein